MLAHIAWVSIQLCVLWPVGPNHVYNQERLLFLLVHENLRPEGGKRGERWVRGWEGWRGWGGEREGKREGERRG